MAYTSLRDFMEALEQRGLLKRVKTPVSPHLEMTEIHRRVLAAGGQALLFEQVVQENGSASMPVLVNLFGTVERIAMAMGTTPEALREVGEMLAFLRQPEPPGGLREAMELIPLLKKAMAMKPKTVKSAPCQDVVLEGDAIDLAKLPVQTCWPGDAAPLITWPLVISKGPHKERQNLGIYRMQRIDKNRLIMRWLSHRGGALDFQEFCKTNPGEPFPVSVALGADPATTLGAVTPVPDALSEYGFAGLLRGEKTTVAKSISNDLQVPATAEYILEGVIHPDDMADEGPFGDHTGYYNEVERFPVFTVTHITHRKHPIYHTTYTGRPPDEPAVLGLALNEVFIPLLQKQFPEISDFYLPPEGCSYRLAVVTMKKQYPGHAKRVMMGVWSFLRQFMYTKFVIVTDDDINARDWKDEK